MSEDLRELLAAADLSRIADAVERLALPSVRLTTRLVDEAAMPLGASKIGGLPDLPPGQAWPEVEISLPAPGPPGSSAPNLVPAMRQERIALGFIAQFNLVEVAPYDVEGLLPPAGMLYFFFSQEGYFNAERFAESWKVLAYDGDLAALRRVPPPHNLLADERYRARAVAFSREITLPRDFPPAPEMVGRPGPGAGLTDSEDGAYRRVREQLAGVAEGQGYTFHRLLGHPEPVQDEMQLECQLESHGLTIGAGGPRAAALAPGAADWRLLLQIDTDEAGDAFGWGDCGRIYYWIRRQAVPRRDFADGWLILQCY